jgi:KDO2-lipid IV(A) lauroyltransferase
VVFGESPAKDLYRLAVWGPWRWALERSPAGWEYRANRALGAAAAAAAPGGRRRARDGLRRAFGERADLDGLVRQVFESHFANQYASFAFGRIDRENWGRYLEIDGLHHLETARDAGRGVVLLHPHMGPAQLPLAVLGALGWPVNQVGGGEVEVEKSRVGRWASDERARLEKRIAARLHDGSGYLRGLVRALARGEIVFTAADGTGGGRELGRRYPREVLGHRMGIPVGGFWLALRSGASIHPLVTVRDGRRHRSIIGAPFPLERSAAIDDALERAADQAAGWLSAALTAWPGDWLFWDAFRPGGLLEAA